MTEARVSIQLQSRGLWHAEAAAYHGISFSRFEREAQKDLKTRFREYQGSRG